MSNSTLTFTLIRKFDSLSEPIRLEYSLGYHLPTLIEIRK